jgi:hypothetical protein
MNVPRLIAITLIFILAAAAWFVLGGSVAVRTQTQDQQLRERVGGLWGTPQKQLPPAFTGTYLRKTREKGHPQPVWRAEAAPAVGVSGSDVTAKFNLDQRRKGLLWYATYAVDFAGSYKVGNPYRHASQVRMDFDFPSSDGLYDGFAVRVDGREVPVEFSSGAATARFVIAPSKTAVVRVGYGSHGLDSWTYAPTGEKGVGAIKDFTLTMLTDFAKVDFPDGAVSPTEKTRAGNGWQLIWHYDSLVSGRPIALSMPQPLNPGPLASRVSFFAPVSLLFFFAAMVLNTATSEVRVHPMNYGFLAAGFFAFHLLFVYLADQIDIGWAFAFASLVSVVLCVGYLSLLARTRSFLIESAASQLIFLVLFSFSFFFEGYTGLAITIGAVLTLGYFMAKTAHVDWEDVFARGRVRPPAPEILAS